MHQTLNVILEYLEEKGLSLMDTKDSSGRTMIVQTTQCYRSGNKSMTFKGKEVLVILSEEATEEYESLRKIVDEELQRGHVISQPINPPIY